MIRSRNHYSKIFLCIVSIMLGGVLMGCNRANTQIIFSEDGLVLPLTPRYNSFYTNYLMVTESYVRIYAEQSFEGEVVHVARKGDVFVILQPGGADDTEYVWYEVVYNGKRGWMLTFDPLLLFSSDQVNYMRLKDQNSLEVK